MGAWIEIYLPLCYHICNKVAPLVGAWIEIIACADVFCTATVAPLVGAWIEIGLHARAPERATSSLLSWERGLKYDRLENAHANNGRSSRGSVD